MQLSLRHRIPIFNPHSFREEMVSQRILFGQELFAANISSVR